MLERAIALAWSSCRCGLPNAVELRGILENGERDRLLLGAALNSPTRTPAGGLERFRVENKVNLALRGLPAAAGGGPQHGATAHLASSRKDDTTAASAIR